MHALLGNNFFYSPPLLIKKPENSTVYYMACVYILYYIHGHTHNIFQNSVFIVNVYNIVLNIFYLIYYRQEHCCICDADQKTPMFIEFIEIRRKQISYRIILLLYLCFQTSNETTI